METEFYGKITALKEEMLVPLADKTELLVFALLAAVLLMLLFYVGTSVMVSCQNSSGRYTSLGRAPIGKKEDIYYLRIKQKMLRNSVSDTYQIEFPHSFAKYHRNEEILIFYGRERVLARIEKKVNLRVAESSF